MMNQHQLFGQSSLSSSDRHYNNAANYTNENDRMMLVDNEESLPDYNSTLMMDQQQTESTTNDSTTRNENHILQEEKEETNKTNFFSTLCCCFFHLNSWNTCFGKKKKHSNDDKKNNTFNEILQFGLQMGIVLSLSSIFLIIMKKDEDNDTQKSFYSFLFVHHHTNNSSQNDDGIWVFVSSLLFLIWFPRFLIQKDDNDDEYHQHYQYHYSTVTLTTTQQSTRINCFGSPSMQEQSIQCLLGIIMGTCTGIGLGYLSTFILSVLNDSGNEQHQFFLFFMMMGCVCVIGFLVIVVPIQLYLKYHDNSYPYTEERRGEYNGKQQHQQQQRRNLMTAIANNNKKSQSLLEKYSYGNTVCLLTFILSFAPFYDTTTSSSSDSNDNNGAVFNIIWTRVMYLGLGWVIAVFGCIVVCGLFNAYTSHQRSVSLSSPLLLGATTNGMCSSSSNTTNPQTFQLEVLYKQLQMQVYNVGIAVESVLHAAADSFSGHWIPCSLEHEILETESRCRARQRVSQLRTSFRRVNKSIIQDSGSRTLCNYEHVLQDYQETQFLFRQFWSTAAAVPSSYGSSSNPNNNNGQSQPHYYNNASLLFNGNSHHGHTTQSAAAAAATSTTSITFRKESANTLARALRIQTTVLMMDDIIRNEQQNHHQQQHHYHDDDADFMAAIFQDYHLIMFVEIGTLIRTMFTATTRTTQPSVSTTTNNSSSESQQEQGGGGGGLDHHHYQRQSRYKENDNAMEQLIEKLGDIRDSILHLSATIMTKQVAAISTTTNATTAAAAAAAFMSTSSSSGAASVNNKGNHHHNHKIMNKHPSFDGSSNSSSQRYQPQQHHMPPVHFNPGLANNMEKNHRHSSNSGQHEQRYCQPHRASVVHFDPALGNKGLEVDEEKTPDLQYHHHHQSPNIHNNYNGGSNNLVLGLHFFQLVEHLILRSLKLYDSWKQIQNLNLEM